MNRSPGIIAIPAYGLICFLAGIFMGMVTPDHTAQPTYHCDGSATRGFAEPGSPDASACWFEVQK